MEHSSSPSSLDTKRSTPWGLLIGLLLILTIIVGSALYAFNERFENPKVPAVVITQ